MRRFESIAALLTLLSLILAWVIGYQRHQHDVESALTEAFPAATEFGTVSHQIYLMESKEGGHSEKRYISIGSGYGYGGPLTAAFVYDVDCRIQSVTVLEHKETVPFFGKLERDGFAESFVGESCLSPFLQGEGVDAVSGATLSSNALTTAVRNSSHRIAKEVFGLAPPEEEGFHVKFGLKEASLVILFIVSLLLFGLRFRFKRHVRWMALFVSILVLGFGCTTLLTVGNVGAFLLGYWPGWRTHLYWYLLLAIVFVPLLLRGKHFYCGSICPFGAVQECLGALGGAKRKVPHRIHDYLRWLPRVLAWIFVFIALLSQNPGIQTHEVFGTFFQLTGTTGQFLLMAAVLIAALFITRPWCAYLCPVRGVTDFVKSVIGHR